MNEIVSSGAILCEHALEDQAVLQVFYSAFRSLVI